MTDNKQNKGLKKTFKGKKPYMKDRKSVKPITDPDAYKEGKNDPMWRTADKVLTKLSASLPFGIPAGLSQDPAAADGSTPFHYIQPGVLSVLTQITAGSSRDYNSPMNLAFRKIYSFVRHANSGSRNYEAADMGLYFTAIGQALSLLGWCQRTLRIATEYSATNRYLPLALLKAMGVNADDVTANLAQLKYIVAWFGRVIGSLAFPDLPYFRACYEAFQYVYRDNDSVKEQFYLLTPNSIGKYDPTYTANGGGVVFKGNTVKTSYILHDMREPSAANLMTYASIFDIIKERMDVLLGDEDIGIISGDILKAFGDKLYKPTALNPDYDVVQHSPEFLQQVHNLTVASDGDVILEAYSQQPGATNTAPYITGDLVIPSTATSLGDRALSEFFIVDAFSREPSPEEVVNCAVLNPQLGIVTKDGGTTFTIDINRVAFDLFLPIKTFLIWSATGNYSIIRSELKKNGASFMNNSIATDVLRITNFDWHPLIWTLDSQDNRTLYVIGDLQNMRIFSYDIGQRVHECATLNLWAFQEHNFY